MAKTWSNRKVTDYVSPVIRTKNRPSSANVFTWSMVILVVVFISIMTYVTIRAENHPAVEQVQTHHQEPDDN